MRVPGTLPGFFLGAILCAVNHKQENYNSTIRVSARCVPSEIGLYLFRTEAAYCMNIVALGSRLFP